MHHFEWQESDRVITIRCLLPLLRRLLLAVVLLVYVFWVGPLLLVFLWDLGSAPPNGGILWRVVWLLQQTLSAALAAGNLLCALVLAWITIHSALFIPETTLRFDKQARLLTISQVAPAIRTRTITVPFDVVEGVGVEPWAQGANWERLNRWFLEIRCRDGRRFRTPATENIRVLDRCALRIRDGALTTKNAVPTPAQGYSSGYVVILGVLIVCQVFFSLTYSTILNDRVLHQNGALVTGRLQGKKTIDRKNVQLHYIFTLPSGREIDARRLVDPSLAAPLEEGDSLAVRYDRNQPNHHVLVAEGKGWVAPLLFVNLLWLIGLVAGQGGDFAQASPGKPWGPGPRDGWC